MLSSPVFFYDPFLYLFSVILSDCIYVPHFPSFFPLKEWLRMPKAPNRDFPFGRGGLSSIAENALASRIMRIAVGSQQRRAEYRTPLGGYYQRFCDNAVFVFRSNRSKKPKHYGIITFRPLKFVKKKARRWGKDSQHTAFQIKICLLWDFSSYRFQKVETFKC